MSKQRRYAVTEVLDEVFANSDSGFDPDIADVNNKNSEINVSDSSSSGTCGSFVNGNQVLQNRQLYTFTLHWKRMVGFIDIESQIYYKIFKLP